MIQLASSKEETFKCKQNPKHSHLNKHKDYKFHQLYAPVGLSWSFKKKTKSFDKTAWDNIGKVFRKEGLLYEVSPSTNNLAKMLEGRASKEECLLSSMF